MHVKPEARQRTHNWGRFRREGMATAVAVVAAASVVSTWLYI